MDIRGRKIAFLGDSITEGTGVEKAENIYWKRLERNTGAVCYGYGIGGTCIAPRENLPAEELRDGNFVTRADDMTEDAEVIVVFGGTNDFGCGTAPFGKIGEKNRISFCGSFAFLLEKLIQRYPDAQLVVLTPLHRTEEWDTEFNEYGIRRDFQLKNYVDAIIEISGYYGVPVLDLYRTSGLQPAVSVLREKYMPDGLHPNDLGHKRIADRLQAFLETL